MKRTCSQCQTEMINDCKVTVEYGINGITITQKRKGMFNHISAKTKAAVCPNCGNVAFYIDEFQKFQN